MEIMTKKYDNMEAKAEQNLSSLANSEKKLLEKEV